MALINQDLMYFVFPGRTLIMLMAIAAASPSSRSERVYSNMRLHSHQLVGGFKVSTHLKHMLVKLDHFPMDRGEKKKTPPDQALY